MLFDMPMWLNFAINLLLGIPLAGLILFMAGALCGAEKLDFLRSLAVAAVAGVLMIPVVAIVFSSFGVSTFMASYPFLGYMMFAAVFKAFSVPDWYVLQEWRTLLLIGSLCFPISLLLHVGLLCTPLARVSVPRGLAVWFIQLPLYALFTALSLGGWLVWQAVEQVLRDPSATGPFKTGAWLFVGFLAVILLIVLGVSILRRYGSAR
jgi:hypothetical protein